MHVLFWWGGLVLWGELDGSPFAMLSTGGGDSLQTTPPYPTWLRPEAKDLVQWRHENSPHKTHPFGCELRKRMILPRAAGKKLQKTGHQRLGQTNCLRYAVDVS